MVFLGQQNHLLCLHYCRLWRSFYRRSANPLFCVYLSVVFVLQCIISCLQEGDRPGQHLRPAGPPLHQLRKGTTALSHNNSTLSQQHSLTTTALSHNNSTLSQHHSLTTTALSHNNSTFPYLTKSDQIGLFIRGKKYLDNSAICREGANQNIFIIHTHLILKITTYLDLPSFL